MYEYKATVVKVVDGDTVDVDIDLGFDTWLHNQRIRLYGIDTPECRTRNKQEKAHGLLANSSWEEHMRSQQKRKESSDATWEKSKWGEQQSTSYSSNKNWLSRTPARIKKK
jgi:micrococcal nuclease